MYLEAPKREIVHCIQAKRKFLMDRIESSVPKPYSINETEAVTKNAIKASSSPFISQGALRAIIISTITKQWYICR